MEPSGKKSRNTRQRGIILDILRERCDHPTADAVYRQARRALPNISLGTVYRNLNVLRDQGLAREIRPAGAPSSRFDGNCLPHAHFFCSECGTMVDLPLPEPLLVRIRDDEAVGSVSALELQMIGTCARCAPPVPQPL